MVVTIRAFCWASNRSVVLPGLSAAKWSEWPHCFTAHQLVPLLADAAVGPGGASSGRWIGVRPTMVVLTTAKALGGLETLVTAGDPFKLNPWGKDSDLHPVPLAERVAFRLQDQGGS